VHARPNFICKQSRISIDVPFGVWSDESHVIETGAISSMGNCAAFNFPLGETATKSSDALSRDDHLARVSQRLLHNFLLPGESQRSPSVTRMSYNFQRRNAISVSVSRLQFRCISIIFVLGLWFLLNWSE